MLHLIVDYDGGSVACESDDEPITNSERELVRQKKREVNQWINNKPPPPKIDKPDDLKS